LKRSDEAQLFTVYSVPCPTADTIVTGAVMTARAADVAWLTCRQQRAGRGGVGTSHAAAPPTSGVATTAAALGSGHDGVATPTRHKLPPREQR
jgi:hypothetical protein